MMTQIRVRGEEIRRFLLDNIEGHPRDLAKVASDRFKITRQAVHKHLRRLISEKAIVEDGQTRNRSYKLAPLVEWSRVYFITPDLEEDVIWRKDIGPILGTQPQNILDLWQFGFTEMFNNAKDHSGGTTIFVRINKTAITTEMSVLDDGVGIFKKIQTSMNLLDERHAVLELSKGKLTTDPKHHSGEGIFFTSRIFDRFIILAGGVYFSHQFNLPEDWISEAKDSSGTFVKMTLNNHTARTTEKVFRQFASGGNNDFGFNKTVVPVALAQYGNDKLVSRSQAKRLLARVELFKTVLLDFTDVPSIGQAFADQVFRVFPQEHPNVALVPLHCNSAVKRMILRAKTGEVQNVPAE
ncbi:MAG: STAS-like domain-containing protein [Candidatus Binatia bacterium]